MNMTALNPTRYFLLTIALVLLLPFGQSLAADISVDADCSLSNAIRSANGEDLVEPMIDCEAGDGEDDTGNSQTEEETIPGLDTITIDVAGTHDGVIALDMTLAVSSNIVIEGAGFSVNGGGNQIFSVTSGSLTLNDLNMSNGFSVENGGVISVTDAELTLNNSAVRDSGARGFGGGIYALDSDVTLLDSVISGNATAASADDYPPVEIDEHDDHGGDSGSDGDPQTATDGHEHESQTDNPDPVEPTATPEATEVPVVEEEVLPEVDGTYGGGLYFAGENSNLVVDRSGVDSNSTPEAGGGIYLASGSAEISNSTISGNSASVDGGGIYSVGNSVFKHLTVVGNTALNGGGIVDAATLQLYNSILGDNTGGDCVGSLNANLGNIIRDGSCNHDGSTADPNLLLLAGSPAYYIPQEGSPAIDAAMAEYCTALDQRGIERGADSCDIGAAEYEAGVFSFQIQSALAALTPGTGGGSASDDDDEDEDEVQTEPTLTPSNCGDLPGHITVTGATPSLSCTMLDWAGVGNQTLVNGGALYAVDLFGWVATPVTVCFQHRSGAIVLLDAANSPRNIVPLRTYPDGDRQCASVDRVGSAVFMPLDFFTSGAINEPVWDVSDCTVTTKDILNLRQGASSSTSILANVLNDVTLSADQRATFFYRVNYYGIQGWLSKDYLALTGNCY